MANNTDGMHERLHKKRQCQDAIEVEVNKKNVLSFKFTNIGSKYIYVDLREFLMF